MEGEGCVTGSIIDELHSWDIQEDQRKVKVVLLEESLIIFILEISKDIKWNVKLVLLEESLIIFILGISKNMKWEVKEVLLEVSLMNCNLEISMETNGR